MRPRFMNRGSMVDLGQISTGTAASMRPRFMNRGSDGYPAKGTMHDFGFNEAPIHESGKSG